MIFAQHHPPPPCSSAASRTGAQPASPLPTRPGLCGPGLCLTPLPPWCFPAPVDDQLSSQGQPSAVTSYPCPKPDITSLPVTGQTSTQPQQQLQRSPTPTPPHRSALHRSPVSRTRPPVQQQIQGQMRNAASTAGQGQGAPDQHRACKEEARIVGSANQGKGTSSRPATSPAQTLNLRTSSLRPNEEARPMLGRRTVSSPRGLRLEAAQDQHQGALRGQVGTRSKSLHSLQFPTCVEVAEEVSPRLQTGPRAMGTSPLPSTAQAGLHRQHGARLAGVAWGTGPLVQVTATSGGAQQSGRPPQVEEVQQADILCDFVSEHSSESSAVEGEPWLDPVERIKHSELEFTEHLGSGEFGQVCRGTYRGCEVAIKALYWDDSLAPELVIKDLAREIESFRHLRHKRLVRFVGACLELPHLCLVTEYMPGGSLYHLLHVRKLRLPLLHGANMSLQLAEGVMFLHSQQPCVVHRDLKSQNVVLDLQLNLKLCDFGLTESMERTHITKKNNGGSPRYMAPELFDSRSKITEKVDIWSMACIFSEIFGGTLPYDHIQTLAELTREMLLHRHPPAIPQGVPEPLSRAIRGCHNFDFRLRPSAPQVFNQLKEGKRRLRESGIL